MSEPREGRPSDKAANPREPHVGLKSTQSDDIRAHTVLRIAWLRVHAELMYGIDEGGQLSSQLWDLAHLLEALDEDGRVEW